MLVTADESYTFHLLPVFDDGWADAGLDDADLARLQLVLMTDPHAGDVMAGAGGLRKVRFARAGGGKSGGVRVCYAVFKTHFVIVLTTVFSKNQKANLSAAEKREMAVLIASYAAALDARTTEE